ncbi:hypothetical protein H4O20_13585 [Aequorivita sp. 609]|jgi:hypothetical protein|uniref:ApeA N-terminal domain 1-containing protein n=1 Tax=Aequorivita TaxID=153265 RepID=UPI001619AA4F|nr:MULTISPECIES: HEPN domain-containing protein [Aequorivita]MBB6682477.1 hypothetical protein [Aequorivita sp. 609]
MKRDEKYYGEVWLENNDQEKKFAVLSFHDDEILIETNLHSTERFYKEPQILGAFNGLGFLTFVDCHIQQSTSGVSEVRIYNPTYTFIGLSHFVDPFKLKINQFYVVNEAIVKWVNHRTWYDLKHKQLNSTEFNDEYLISDKNLKITIRHYLNLQSNRAELNIKNKGEISFQTEEYIDILEAIEIYDHFQRVLQLLRGGSAQFDKFGFKCPSCDDWQEVYYNDKKLTKSKNNYVHTTYFEVKDDLHKVLNGAYSNEIFKFCLDKLMENFISRQSSYNKRFTNSIIAYEAFIKRHSDKQGGKLSRGLQYHQNIFILISQMDKETWKTFPSKVVRSRDYHTHSNLGNRDIFTEYELLYISLLIDFVIGYLLLETVEVSEELLDKFVQHGRSVFIDMQKTNSILSANPLLKKK